MKCYEVRMWLYSTAATEPLPATIERHLEECVRCRTRRRVLGRLDERVRSLPIPESATAAKDDFRKRLEQVPGPAAAVAAKRPEPRGANTRVIRWTVGVSAACVLVLVGWMIGRWGPMSAEQGDSPILVAKNVVKDVPPKSKPPHPEVITKGDPPKVDPKIEPKIEPTPKVDPAVRPKIDWTPMWDIDAAKNVDILVRALKHTSSLADSTNTVQQVKILDALAEDLRAELQDSLRRQAYDESRALAETYAAVARNGLVPRIERLTETARKSLGLVGRYQATADELAKDRTDEPPMTKEMLDWAGLAARDVADALAGQPRVIVVARPVPRRPSMLKALVDYGLTAAAEPNPLQRASLCADFTIKAAPSLLILSGKRPPADADALGAALGEWVDRSVGVNLDRVDPANRDDADKVRARVAAALESLSSDLSTNVVPGDESFHQKSRRALDASTPGWKRAADR